MPHTLGNRALGELLQAGVLRAKLAVGGAGDALEREADRVADELDHHPAAPPARGLSPRISLQPSPTAVYPAHPSITAEPADGAAQAESTLKSAAAGGQPLDPAVRAQMEVHLGADLSRVRIHTGALSSALNRELNSLAFTYEEHVHFAGGQYDPSSRSGRRLLAHELTHVVQQSARPGRMIQRQKAQGADDTVSYPFQVPPDVATTKELFLRLNLFIFHRDAGLTWSLNGKDPTDADVLALRGKQTTVTVHRSALDSKRDPNVKKEREESTKALGGLQGSEKTGVDAESDRRYYERSGEKPGTKIRREETGKAELWSDALTDVLKDKTALSTLPPALKELLGSEASYKPTDYQHLLKIAEKLKQFTPEDLAAYKLLTIRATDDLDVFEKSVDMFLARREELKKALAQAQQQPPGGATGASDPSLRERFDEQWKGLDESAIAGMSESDRYTLARQKADELTRVQLKYMKDHPGETIKGFAESATLANTPQTFSGIADDLKEAATGDANSWARWAAGTGAGAKLSGWLLAVAGVLYVASWFTGIGELATIAAAAGVLLGSTIVLSTAESELRIKAASQATNPQDFKRNIELGAAAQTTAIVSLATLAIAAVLHFTAKALFPKTLGRLGTSLKNFRERVRLKGSIYELKPQIKGEVSTVRAELAKQIEAAKQDAANTANELGKLSTEKFAERVDGAAPGSMFDQTKVPPGQRVKLGELLKTPEGRKSVESYRQQLIEALKTDVPAGIDRLGQEYATKLDELTNEVDAAKNHDDLKAALDKMEGSLSEQHAKQFMQGEQDKLTQQKVDQADNALAKQLADAAKAAADLAAKRLALKNRFEKLGLAKGKGAETAAKWAADAGIIERVDSLLNFAEQGKLGNPAQVLKLVEFIAKGAREHIQAIDDALARMAKGDKVDIEAEADVVDHTRTEAVQHKRITGKSTSALLDNVKSAFKQLAGKGNKAEVPPRGYTRIAELQIVEPENPQFNADGPTLEKYLKEAKALSDAVGTHPDADPNATLEGLAPDLRLRVTNAKGTFTFKGPNLDLVK